MWDNGHRNNYPYGIMGHFAVMTVDEPRVLRPDQFIEPGCLVRRGLGMILLHHVHYDNHKSMPAEIVNLTLFKLLCIANNTIP